MGVGPCLLPSNHMSVLLYVCSNKLQSMVHVNTKKKIFKTLDFNA